MAGFFDFVMLIVSVVVSLAIMVPLTGTLVRFRANFNPKGLGLDPEDGTVPHTGPVVTSYFTMLARVYRIEGWNGLYKGLMPTIVTTMGMSLFILLLVNETTRHSIYRPPSEAGVLSSLFYSIFSCLVSLPAAIITCRSITTPYKLPWFQPVKSLRVLLTPTEMRRPWVLYTTASGGLLYSQVLHIFFVVGFLGPLQRLLVSRDDFSAWKFSIYVLVVIIATAVLTPLEVVSTRLAIQRNLAADYDTVAQDPDSEPEFAGVEEDVIGLRNESDPYMGLMDSIKRIIEEEGTAALYRAWWLTMLSGLMGGFV
ncbi:mitochondrial carrier [Fistulina hepatica ATCC 64428]|uniref:Mitochondrial carrier n=1 Tax=Fistulina hepatica ATCC 64428 TaxID=1128425 RepID=A0A0D7A8P3_9AGAR|nr:mitochondrial carrier [Fistulina hepatica ATCC 64428]